MVDFKDQTRSRQGIWTFVRTKVQEIYDYRFPSPEAQISSDFFLRSGIDVKFMILQLLGACDTSLTTHNIGFGARVTNPAITVCFHLVSRCCHNKDTRF